METDKFSPEQSLKLIAQVIAQARTKFEENGFIYVFWGALVAIASIGQFVLLRYEYYEISWYPYLLLPLGSVFSAVYYSKKKSEEKIKVNLIGKIISALWKILAIYMMILGFLFANELKENLIPVILMLMSIGIVVSGTSIKSKLLLYSGILIGISAFSGFYIEQIYQPLLMGVVSILAILIPGIILMIQYKRNKNV